MIERAFSILQLPAIDLVSGDLLPVLSSWRRQSVSGLAQCHVEGGGEFNLLLARGDLIHVQHPMATLDLRDIETWAQKIRISGKPVWYRFAALPPQSLRPIRILLENPVHALSVKLEHLHSLEALLDENTGRGEPVLLRLDWQDAMGISTAAVLEDPQRHTLLVDAGQIASSSMRLPGLLQSRPGTCTLSFYHFDMHSLAWQEYMLSVGFANLVNLLWAAYKQANVSRELASLRQGLTFLRQANNWQIWLSEAGFTSQMVFASTRDAARVYQRILDELLKGMAGQVGEKRLAGLLTEAVGKLAHPYRDVVVQEVSIHIQAHPSRHKGVAVPTIQNLE